MKKTTENVLTAETRQIDIVILAVYLLGGDHKSVDTEDVAVKAYELAPGLFSWQKYPDQINLEIVRVNLSNAKKAKYGSLLTGAGRTGWRLSSSGLEWINSIGKPILEAGLKWSRVRLSAGSIDTVRKRRERARLLATNAWASWNDHSPVTQQHAMDVFRVDDYSTTKMVEIKVVRLQSLFDSDKELSEFLKAMGKVVLGNGGR